MDNKICGKCKILKPITEFCKRKTGVYHRQSWCKECYKLRNRTKKRREYNSHWRIKNRYDSEGFARIRRNVKARVGIAVRKGKIKKLPCEICGSTIKTEGHHPDYSKPLEVRWLCQEHHRKIHLSLRNQAIKNYMEEGKG